MHVLGNTTGNELQNNILAKEAGAASYPRAPQNIVDAIQTASQKTGVDFPYLMHKANTESSFRPDIRAKTSSATGLYQFIDSTWLDMVRKHGDKYGLATQAGQIDANGRVSDGQARTSILHLRKDPELAAVMAAEYAAENKSFLERTIGGEIGSTELYLAHFMGPSGSAAFLNEYRHNASNIAAHIFPREAAANRGVFYDPSTGKPRTLHEVYAFFDGKFQAEQATNPVLNAAREPARNDTQTLAQAPAQETVQTTQAERTRAIKAYQHVPSSSIFDPIEVRGNWNKKKPQAAKIADATSTHADFNIRITRTALRNHAESQSSDGVNATKLDIFAQALRPKTSISPVDAAFARRLNG